MDKQIRYLPDETGKNPDNLVRGERHHLPTQVRGRVIVPTQGSFFGESVVVRDRLSKRKLKPKVDYTVAGLRQKYSKIADGPIYAFILVTDDKCSEEVEIDYQVYATNIVDFVEPTLALLEESFESNDGIPMAKLLKLPKGWPTTFHYHDLGDVDKFEFTLFCLDRIRNSLLLNNPAVFKYLMDFENMIYMLKDKASTHFEAELYAKMYKFTKEFGKQIFGLERVNNWPLMIENDGMAVASQLMSSHIIDKKEAYLNVGILSEFCKQLFQIYVNVDDTNIGSSRERVEYASTANFESLPIGSIFTINDYNFAAIAGNPEIDKFYPDRMDRTNGYVVRKITSHQSGYGSLYMYTGRENARTYILRLFTGPNGVESKFTYIANSLDQPSYLADVLAHEEDRFNPHMDDKRDVDLAQVENLPVASKEDLFCNMPVRKYLTVESILHYMKRFKTGKKDTSEIYSNLSEASIRKQMQTIYSPCGAWDDNIDVDKIELCRVIEVPTTLPPLDPVWAVKPDRTLIAIEMVDEEDITTTTTTTTTTQSPGVFKVEHYGDFINGDGVLFFSIVSSALANGDMLGLDLMVRDMDGEISVYDANDRPHLKRSILTIMPPHTVGGGSKFEFKRAYYEAKLMVYKGGKTGEVLGESAWIKVYNQTPEVAFDLLSVQLVGKNEDGLCATLQLDGYFDPKWKDTPDYYKQWLGYRKSDQLLEFAAWKSLRNAPHPGKFDIYVNDYFNVRGPTNYEKTNIDPDTGKPRDMIATLSGLWYSNDGVTVSGAPWPNAIQFNNFDLKIRYMFYRNGQLDPVTIEQYFYRTKEDDDIGLPAAEQDNLIGAFMSKLTISHDKKITIATGNQLTSPPFKWLDDINKI